MKHYRNDTWTLDDGLGLGRAGDQVTRMVLEVDLPGWLMLLPWPLAAMRRRRLARSRRG
jgi:hypothetical protein